MKKKIKILAISIIIIISIFLALNIFFKYRLKQNESLKILDRNGNLLYEAKSDDARVQPYQNIADIPDFIKKIVIFREDRRFYYHFGVDFIGNVRAIYEDISNLNLKQGASTIDQQDIKLSQKAFSRGITQKLKEIFLAVNLNFHYSKDDLLLYYVNNLPFGNGIYGFKTACNLYFSKDCQNLSEGELIYLFSITKFGRKIDVSLPSYQLAQQLGIKNYSQEDFKNIGKSIKLNIGNNAPFYIDYLLDTQIQTESNEIKTSFDYDLYQKIDKEITNLKDHFATKNAHDLCAIVLDKQGNIITMNQLKKFGDKKGGYINYCLAKRQVGSSIKPFLYTIAFYDGIYKPDDTIIDGDVTYDLGDGTKYSPKNFDMGYHGKVTVSQALGNSLNIPAVKTLDKVGLPNFRNFLGEIGNYVGTSEKWDEDYGNYGLSLALGSKEISPLDFAKMWTIFVKQDNGHFMSKYKNSINTTKSILSDNQNRLISFDVDNWLNLPGTFAKTGTSRNFVDGWTCGGNTDYIVCVWIGNYDNSQMKDSGVNTAGILRNHIMQILGN